ncbi:MAG: hypothetical protein OHK0052_16310 [Anaerolineales bacterium]
MKHPSVVFDASVAIKALFRNPLQAHCLALMVQFDTLKPVVPALWVYETTSALTKAVHFGHITAQQSLEFQTYLESLEVELIVPNATQTRYAIDWTYLLKRANAYGCYYLALAQSLTCDFWTADQNFDLPWLHWIGDLEPLTF